MNYKYILCYNNVIILVCHASDHNTKAFIFWVKKNNHELLWYDRDYKLKVVI